MEKTTPCAVIATLWINSTQWPRTLVPTVEQMAGQMVRHGMARLRMVSDVANTRLYFDIWQHVCRNQGPPVSDPRVLTIPKNVNRLMYI
jgi:hypothetical protein